MFVYFCCAFFKPAPIYNKKHFAQNNSLSIFLAFWTAQILGSYMNVVLELSHTYMYNKLLSCREGKGRTLSPKTLKKGGNHIIQTAQNLLVSCGKTPFPLRKLAFHGNSNRHRVVLNSAPEHITSFKVVLTHSLHELEVGTLKNVRIVLFNHLTNVLASSNGQVKTIFNEVMCSCAEFQTTRPWLKFPLKASYLIGHSVFLQDTRRFCAV